MKILLIIVNWFLLLGILVALGFWALFVFATPQSSQNDKSLSSLENEEESLTKLKKPLENTFDGTFYGSPNF